MVKREALFIRTDASSRTGVGHFMRMLALAEAWRELGGTVTFAGTFSTELASRAEALGCATRVRDAQVDDATWTVAQLSTTQHDVAVLDGYNFPVEFQRAVRRSGTALLIVDDNGENGAYDADWILNVNLHASERAYASRNADAKLLMGPTYALVRGEFRRRSGAAKREGRRVLVTMGGADPPDATRKVLEAITPAHRLEATVLVGAANPRLREYEALAPPNVRLLFDVTDVAAVMAGCDVALVGAGGTLWELGVVGVPCVAVSLADNQVELAHALHARGAIDYAGDARSMTSGAAWLQHVTALLDEPDRAERLVASARQVVDGRGALRIAQLLKET